MMQLLDRDDVDARLPILATRLGASFARTDTLDVTMTVVGRYESGAAAVARPDLEGDCDGATHVVASLSVGAFAIGTGQARAVEANADFAHVGHASQRKRLDAAGMEESCETARRADATPPDGCAIPLRVELRALRTSTSLPPPPPAAAASATGDTDAMRRPMESAKKELAWCHRVARAASPDLSGALTLSVKLARNGNVRSVAAKAEGNVDNTLAQCAVERVGHVLFPSTDDDRPRVIVIPVVFRPLAR